MTYESPSGEGLERLVRMTGELDAFERDLGLVESAPHRITHAAGRRARPLRRYAGLGLGVAACVAMAVLAPRIGWGPSAPRSPSPAPGGGHATANPVPAVASPEECTQMVIALYRDETDADLACDECWCVQTWAQDWPKGHDVTGIHRDVLIRESLARACVPNPERMIVVGLSGRPADLPVTEDQAREMALCLVDSNGTEARAGNAVRSRDCVPHGLDLRVETWGRQQGG